MVVTGVNTKAFKKGDAAPAAPAAGHFRIYNMRFCPWAERALIYASAKKIPTEIVNINLQEKPEWYFEKHFQGKVPALEHDGRIVIESGVIPEYLDDLLPESRILPVDAYEKAQQKLLLERLSVLPPAFYGLVASFKDPSLKEEKVANLHKALAEIESLLKDTYFAGSSAGYPDYLIFPFVERVWWASDLADLGVDAQQFPGPQYPKLTKWFKSIYALPQISDVVQKKEVAHAFLKQYISGGAVDYDVGI